MAKHEQHRQGIVYGPVRPTGQRDRGAIMGSLLGVLVVVATAGVLGFGVIMYFQGQNPPVPVVTASPGAVATATLVASLSPSPTPAVETTAPSIPPTVLPSASPTPGITPPPTPFVPQVLVGPGYVTFGTEADSQLLITDPRSTFSLDERMVWSAQLTERADSVDLVIQILKLDPDAPSGQRLVREDAVRPRVRGAQTFLRRINVENVTDGPGLYTIRYLRGDQILSEGSFLVPGG